MRSLRAQGEMGGECHHKLAGEAAKETCSPKVAKQIRNTPWDTFLISQEGRKGDCKDRRVRLPSVDSKFFFKTAALLGCWREEADVQ